MSVMLNRRTAAMAAVGLLLAGPVEALPMTGEGQAGEVGGQGASRPLGVEDVVALEAFGRGSISPGGAWAVFERRGAYDTVPRFDYAQRSVWAIFELWRVDLRVAGAAPVRVLADEGPGLMRGPWSPDGGRLLVTRFGEGRFEVGIVSVADWQVRWTGLTPEIPLTGAAVDWVSDDVVALTVRPDGSLPAILRYYSGAQARTAEAWDRTARGREPSRTVVETRGGVFAAETPAPDQALVRLDARTGDHRVLARGQITDFAVSPDGARIAVVEGVEPLPIDPGPLLQNEADRRQRLRLIDVVDGRTRAPLPGLDLGPHLLRWSPDGREVLVWARRDGADWTAGELMRVGEAGGRIVDLGPLTPGTATEILRGVRADWLGDRPVIHARSTVGDRFDWHALGLEEGPRVLTAGLARVPGLLASAGAETVTLFADGGWWRLGLEGVERLSPEDLRVTGAPISDPEQPFRLRTNEAPRRAWVAALGAGGESWVLEPGRPPLSLGGAGRPDVRLVAASLGAALVQTREGLVDTLRLRTAGGERRLAAVNEGFAGVVLAGRVAVAHRDLDDRRAVSQLVLPDGGAAAARGLIVQVYPGSVDTGVWPSPLILTHGIRAEVLAGAGYAVLSPVIPMAENGSGEIDAFARSVDRAVDAALAAHPGLPADRIAVLGHSYGGYAALGIATRSSRYRSYIVSSGMSDLIGHWGEFIPATRALAEDGPMLRDQQGWVEAGQGGRSVPPWADPDGYGAHSPYLAAERITAPVLLLAADLDYVPLSQAERIFSVLHRRGIEARLVTYWGEHHHRWSPANIRDQYGQVFDWLERTLGPGS
jgi:dipeptidyl aminopeptidase/acylaminoacyl peptidase